MLLIISLILVAIGIVLVRTKEPEPSLDIPLMSTQSKRLIGAVLVAIGAILVFGEFISENGITLPRMGKRMY
jgi:hypothetical protein